jgi:hypothetical protein
MAVSFPSRRAGDTATVRLTRKLAERIDGIDLSRHKVGDVLIVPSHQARLLVAEGWAEIVPPHSRRDQSPR